jgi:CHASE3 domain sensor protein
MSDRLAELSRQRALVQEHLAWLDAEIARVRVQEGAALAALAATPSPSAEPITAAASSETLPLSGPAVSADTVLEQYRVAPEALRQDVRKGCLLYFAAAFVLLGIVVVVLYFSIGSRP